MQKTGYLDIPTNHEVLDTMIFLITIVIFGSNFDAKDDMYLQKSVNFRFFRHVALEPIRNSCKNAAIGFTMGY